MRALIMVAVVILSVMCPLERAQARLTAADADAVTAIERQLFDANRALLATQKGTPPSSLAFDCYANASEAAGTLSDTVGILSALVSLATLLRHDDDIRIAEHFIASAATEVVNVAQVEENWVNGLEGSCSQDSLVVYKLNSLLALIGRARAIAASLKQRLPPLSPSR